MKAHYYLILFALGAVLAMGFVPPIAQDLAYHQFADKRGWEFIPNAGDVLSNIPFAIVGILGLCWAIRISDTLRSIYAIFFAGVFLTAFGSAYYHWSPNNASLIWDRLPMTIAFVAFFVAVVSERVSPKFSICLVPFLILGIFSVWYWAEYDDLRFYALVQFLPMLLLPVILWIYPSHYTKSQCLWWMLFWYVVAKILEAADRPVFEALSIISGHSLKHIAAAIAPLVLWHMLRVRQRLN